MKEIKFQEKREDFIEGIDDEFQDLASQLSNMDFSKKSNKNSILNTTLKNINNEGDKNMKKINKIKKTGIAAASLLIASTLVAQTTFAQDVVNKIIKSISLGHFTAEQYDSSNEDNYTEILSANLRGKLFDKNRNALDKITADIIKNGIYTKDGEKVAQWNPKDGSILTEKQEKEEEEKAKENTFAITDIGKLNGYTCFEVKVPSYLPDGYKFEKAEFYKEGEDSDKYATLYFKNQETGKEIYMQQRFACEETRGDLATDDKIENIKINGVDAVLEGEHNITWEANNIVYFMSGKGINKDDVIKIAESIK